jgi:hypothetical protein
MSALSISRTASARISGSSAGAASGRSVVVCAKQAGRTSHTQQNAIRDMNRV